MDSIATIKTKGSGIKLSDFQVLVERSTGNVYVFDPESGGTDVGCQVDEKIAKRLNIKDEVDDICSSNSDDDSETRSVSETDTLGLESFEEVDEEDDDDWD